MKLAFALISHRCARGYCIAAALIFSVIASPVCAATYSVCVTDAQELQQALTAGSDGGAHSGDDIDISLAAATYKTGSATGNKPFHFTSTASTGSLEMRGGYGLSCNSYTGSPTLAKLDGNGTTQVLNIKSENGQVGLLQFTIQNGNTSDNGGGLNVNYATATSSAQETNIFYLIIKDNQSQSLGGGLAISSDSQSSSAISVDSTIVIGNSATANYGAGILQNNAGGTTTVSHDTNYNNTTTQTAGTGGLLVNSVGASIGLVVDSIFWGNTNIGLGLSGFNNYVDYCDYGKLAGDAPLENNGPLSVNPQFVDVANENFHLTSGSPLLGASGTTFGLTYDVEGHRYAEHGDIGTYAETIFIGDFETDTF
jgi:hypothetical protein